MKARDSGCYVVDCDFTVVSVNEPMKQVYPTLENGKKCYSCLMGLNAPCSICPIVHEKKGPHTYLSQADQKAITVDAVPLYVEGHGNCYAMILNTVTQEELNSALLPTSEEEMKAYPLIRALAVDYENVFSIRIDTGDMELFRYNGFALDPSSRYRSYTSFQEAVLEYIDHHVMQEDQARMVEETRLERIKESLKETESLAIHFRVMRGQEQHYYLCKVVRIGDADNFDQVVMGAICEDEEIERQKQNVLLEQSLVRAETDSLTGLMTREAFMMRCEERLKENEATGYDLCILKLERLSQINHSFGRMTGDRVLRVIGSLLKKYESESVLMSYFGEGVFISISLTEDEKVREASVRAFEKEAIENSPVKELSMRWALYTDVPHDQPMEVSYEKANYTLSIMRHEGSNFSKFDQLITSRMDREEGIELRFEEALNKGELSAWYQPKYSTRTGKIVGAEALCRWITTGGEIISPAEFIPILEKCGKIRMLDQFMYRSVCAFQQRMKKRGADLLPISVNMSRAGMFLGDAAELFSSIADEFSVEHSLLPIEITETAAMQSDIVEAFSITMLKRGFSLHMDDFGSGYSSFSNLARIPFDTIKLDKTLVDCIGQESGQSIINHVISYMHDTGRTVVAEGVENYEQYLFLKYIGCDQIQGYYFSKPIDEASFEKLICHG